MKNKMITGDCLEVMRGMESGFVDLIATDPPFNTGRDFGAYVDSWEYDINREMDYSQLGIDAKVAVDAAYRLHSESMAAFCCFLGVRLVEMHRILKPSGSIYLHCDQTANSYIRILMDAVFGENNLRNMVTWKRSNNCKASTKQMPRNTDTILFYTKDDDVAYYAPQYLAPNEEYVAKAYKLDDMDGKGCYRNMPLASPRKESGYHYDYKGYKPPATGWRCPLSTMQRYEREGVLIFPKSLHGRLGRKGYLTDYKGNKVSDIWDDIKKLESKSAENTDYPTQKPIALYSRIIQASCPEKGWVLDPFAGSGTTLVAAHRLGRHAIGIDVNPETQRIVEERIK